MTKNQHFNLFKTRHHIIFFFRPLHSSMYYSQSGVTELLIMRDPHYGPMYFNPRSSTFLAVKSASAFGLDPVRMYSSSSFNLYQNKNFAVCFGELLSFGQSALIVVSIPAVTYCKPSGSQNSFYKTCNVVNGCTFILSSTKTTFSRPA